MKKKKKKPKKRPNGGRHKTVDRAILTLQLLAILPSHPVMSMAELQCELSIDARKMRRMLSDLRDLGVQVEHEIMRDGQHTYYLGPQSKPLVDRILRVSKEID